ncbi:acyl-CoA thioesterase [Pseudomonas batumici]|uniref:4-hydroxybenzoyl-CoA thioesterase domain protein n=1 Tax=Pseudomonas batumici TaxID=226910 RepID=A0A0C2IEN6_9PSED|nr:thioesterase family protein [Pseudomonas batumici]KIH83427.1 4-hydroxybenzoyl-CoA thioesterase domain protein [Pseudomonas batumici]
MVKPWDLPNPFVFDLAVDNADIDELGHVNHSVYVKWLEHCAWSHSLSLGITLADYRRLDRGMAVVRNEVDYLASAYEGERLLIATWIVSVQRITLVRHFQVIRAADMCVLLRAITTFACVELSTGKPRRMPEEFATSFGGVIVAEVSNT